VISTQSKLQWPLNTTTFGLVEKALQNATDAAREATLAANEAARRAAELAAMTTTTDPYASMMGGGMNGMMGGGMNGMMGGGMPGMMGGMPGMTPGMGGYGMGGYGQPMGYGQQMGYGQVAAPPAAAAGAALAIQGAGAASNKVHPQQPGFVPSMITKQRRLRSSKGYSLIQDVKGRDYFQQATAQQPQTCECEELA